MSLWVGTLDKIHPEQNASGTQGTAKTRIEHCNKTSGASPEFLSHIPPLIMNAIMRYDFRSKKFQTGLVSWG